MKRQISYRAYVTCVAGISEKGQVHISEIFSPACDVDLIFTGSYVLQSIKSVPLLVFKDFISNQFCSNLREKFIFLFRTITCPIGQFRGVAFIRQSWIINTLMQICTTCTFLKLSADLFCWACEYLDRCPRCIVGLNPYYPLRCKIWFSGGVKFWILWQGCCLLQVDGLAPLFLFGWLLLEI